MRKISHIVVSITLTILLSFLPACTTDKKNNENQQNYEIENIDIFPFDRYQSHNVGQAVLYDDFILIPRISEWFRFSDEIIGETGDPNMHMALEFGSVAAMTGICLE